MTGSDEVEDNRLVERLPRPPRREPLADTPEAVDEPDLPVDQDIEAVTKLMGFLRSNEV